MPRAVARPLQIACSPRARGDTPLTPPLQARNARGRMAAACAVGWLLACESTAPLADQNARSNSANLSRRIDGAALQELESYISEHTHATFSHGICPDCRSTVVADHLEQWRRGP